MFSGRQLLLYSLARPYVLSKRTSWFPTGGVVGLVILHAYILKQNVSQLHNKYFVTHAVRHKGMLLDCICTFVCV